MARLPLVSPVDRALFLKAQHYLEGLSSNVLAVLASYTEESLYRAGETIRHAGAPIDRVIFLAQGVVETLPADGDESGRRQVEAPGAIGLAHLFARAEKAPGLQSRTDTLCLEIRAMDLKQILEDHFPLVAQMSRTSCEEVSLTVQALGKDRPSIRGFREGTQDDTPVELDLVARLARLKQMPFFAHANLGVLSELVRYEPPQTIAAGAYLWREGERIDRMYVVLDGRFRSVGEFGSVISPSGATLGFWEMFCDSACFEGWVADAPSRIIPIRRDLFVDVLEDHFDFAQDFLEHVSSEILRGWDVMAARRRAAEMEANSSAQHSR